MRHISRHTSGYIPAGYKTVYLYIRDVGNIIYGGSRRIEFSHLQKYSRTKTGSGITLTASIAN
jgi:hypothetical protein